MREKRKQEKAITLIALIITIIVLLILAGISITTLTGENGILNKANKAKEETIKAEDIETLKLIGMNVQIENISNNLSNKEFMDLYEQEIKNNETFKGVTITRKDAQTVEVVTKKGNVYEVTENEVKFIKKQGEQEETTPPDLQESDITLKITPSGWTNGEVKVEVTTKIEGYTLQYSTDGTKWNNYITGIPMSQNGPIYTRLINQSGVAGGYATGNVTNIDKTDPTVSVLAEEVTADSAKLTVTASDEQSGLEESGTYQYYLGNTLKETTTTNSYTFTGLVSETTYTLKVIVTDKTGNTTEKTTTITTVKRKTVVEELAEGEYVNYIDKSGTTRKSIVLFNNSDYGIQIITSGVVTRVTLGNSDFDLAKTSYNNAISTLNAKANEYLNTTYASSARCVGSIPNDPNSESEYYTRNDSGFASYNGIFRDKDTNYEIDYNQMKKLGITNTTGTSYWLASRNIENYVYSDAYFCIRSIYTNLSSNNLCRVDYTDTVPLIGYETDKAFRPVFTLKSRIKITGGLGTSDNPYTLGT